MSSEKRPSRAHRRLILLLILLLIAIAGIGLYSIRASRVRQNSASPLIGTWRGDLGNVLNFRPDGTARVRSSDDTRITYLEWSIAPPNELQIWQYSSRNSIGAWIVSAQRVTGGAPPTDRCEIVEISSTQMRLRFRYNDPKTGNPTTKIITFVRVQDKQLEAAR